MSIQLYPHQKPLVSKTMTALLEDRTVMLQSPTGSGKTVMFTHIGNEYMNNSGRVLVIAHKEELITQIFEAFYDFFGVVGSIIKSGHKPDYSRPLQIASIQTLKNRKKPQDIELIIVDEGHHITANTYEKILEYYPNAKVLAASATPIRTSGEGFDHLIKALVQGLQIKELEDIGRLCPAEMCVVPINQKKLDEIGLSKGDYNNASLSKLMMTDEMVNYTVRKWFAKYQEAQAKGQRLPTIAFGCNIKHSKKLAKAFNALPGIKAIHLDGGGNKKKVKREHDLPDGDNEAVEKLTMKVQQSTDDEDSNAKRKKAKAMMESGEIEVICNVDLFTEGVNIQMVECIVDMAPTLSLIKYLQKRGRGSRTWTCPTTGYVKKRYVLIDATNGWLEFGMPNADRKWTLQGIPKKERKKKRKGVILKMTDADGISKAVSKEILTKMAEESEQPDLSVLFDDLKLDELTAKEVEHLNFFDNSLIEVEDKGKKKYQAFINYCEMLYSKIEYPSKFELEYIQLKIEQESRYSRLWWAYHYDKIIRKVDEIRKRRGVFRYSIALQGVAGNIEMVTQRSKFNQSLPICYIYEMPEKEIKSMRFWWMRTRININQISLESEERACKNIQYRLKRANQSEAVFMCNDYTTFFLEHEKEKKLQVA